LLGFSKYCSISGRSQQVLSAIYRRTEEAHDLVAKLRRHGEWGRLSFMGALASDRGGHCGEPAAS
jgi:hypothetical protein